ncbi:hypothetical protein [Streptobacillus canis]|uniref:hypothetical protein n=1 Tax=Streptobacillus canis TaxID=2678686 RepID=UPI0012E2F425|nr:hypothetical protein [Streptobacillus canis]
MRKIIKPKLSMRIIKYGLFFQAILKNILTIFIFQFQERSKIEIYSGLISGLLYLLTAFFFSKNLKNIYLDDEFIKIGNKKIERNQIRYIILKYKEKESVISIKSEDKIYNILAINFSLEKYNEIKEYLANFKNITKFKFLEKDSKKNIYKNLFLLKKNKEIFSKLEVTKNQIKVSELGLEVNGEIYSWDNKFEIFEQKILIKNKENQILLNLEYEIMENNLNFEKKIEKYIADN